MSPKRRNRDRTAAETAVQMPAHRRKPAAKSLCRRRTVEKEFFINSNASPNGLKISILGAASFIVRFEQVPWWNQEQRRNYRPTDLSSAPGASAYFQLSIHARGAKSIRAQPARRP